MRQFGGDSLLGVLLHRCSFGSRADAERRLALLARSNCHRRGRWQESSHPWDTKENIRWSVQLPGWGTSSPVVYGNRVFVTSEVEDGGKKSLLTLCFDRNDGRELWRHDFGFGVNQSTHQKSNLAVNTPAVSEDAVYVAFGNADIARYSHDGKLAWVTRYLTMFDDPKMAWGYCLSPVVMDDAILFPWDHHTGPCFLIGLGLMSGS